MKITITMELDDEFAEPDHPMGVTEEGHVKINEALEELGTDIIVSRSE